jgi:Gp49-like protein DUF891
MCRILYTGNLHDVAFAQDASGCFPAKEFYQSLNQADKAKIMRICMRLADQGQLCNVLKFKHLGDGLFEIKSHQIRIFCFLDDRTWWLTDGVRKKRDRHQKSDIERARRIRSHHLGR